MIYHLENTCKNKDDKDKTTKLEEQIIELQKTVSNMQNKTVNNEINNSMINNNSNNNNTVNNIIYINKTGTEDVLKLTKTEIADIFDKSLSSVESFVKTINFNDRLHLFLGTLCFPKNKNWVV